MSDFTVILDITSRPLLLSPRPQQPLLCMTFSPLYLPQASPASQTISSTSYLGLSLVLSQSPHQVPKATNLCYHTHQILQVGEWTVITQTLLLRPSRMEVPCIVTASK